MTRVATLHKNSQHEIAENLPWTLRLRYKTSELPSKLDWILLSEQYIAVYQALEKQLAFFETGTVPSLELFRAPPWAGRAALLRADVNAMIARLAPHEKVQFEQRRRLFPATYAMINNIQYSNEHRLFAWFAVRCLGDVFGGQALNDYTQRAFQDNALPGTFYTTVSSALQDIVRHVNKASLSADEEKIFSTAADDVFQFHIDLFEQMESARSARYVFRSPYVLFGASLLVAAAVYACSPDVYGRDLPSA